MKTNQNSVILPSVLELTLIFNVPQKAEEEAQKAKEDEEKRKKKEEERARRRARGLEDEEEEKEEGKKEGEEDEEEQEGEEKEEEQQRQAGEIIKGFYYGKTDKFWVSMVGVSLTRTCTCAVDPPKRQLVKCLKF